MTADDAMRESAPPIEIELLPGAESDNAELMARITELTNQVYAVAEDGLWTAGATRTSGRVVGCVRVHRLDEGTGEFGMLAADPARRGLGVGRELVRFAERKSSAEGVRSMQLELLVPRGWKHPTKVFLAAWYTRIGYRVARTGAIEEAYPALAPLLATPCDFVIYHKHLDL